MNGLHLDGIELRLRGSLLARLSLRVAPGEVVSVMAASGSGKSSLLSALIGALPPGFSLSGQLWLNGRNLTALPTAARRIGLMFQEDVLFDHLSVGGNLAFGLPPGGNRAARRAEVDAALAEAGLAGFATRDPATLSGGQRARVALLRTLLSRPEALLLDEPFAGLDTGLRAQIRDFTFGHSRARGLPVILVTHDPEDARAAGGPVLDLFGNPVVLP